MANSRAVLKLVALALLGVALATRAWADPLPQPRGPSEDLFPAPGTQPFFFPPRGTDSDIERPPDATRGRRAHAAPPPAPKVLTPAEKAESIRKALMPRPPAVVTRRKVLDDLYVKLAAARDEDEAKGLAGLIGDIWMRSESDTANLVMQRAMTAMEAKNYPLALKLLDRLVTLQPGWSEAWNKRATVRFMAGDIDGAMVDVDHVLRLEPHHFGALEGLAMILKRTGFDKRALDVYRRALAIYPHQPEIETIVEKLTLDVEGQGI